MDLNILVVGLTAGSLYALVAVGFNILYRPTNVLNFAQGDLVMLGAMVGASTLGFYMLPWPAALVVAVTVVSLIAVVEERVAVAPVLRRSSQSFAWIISTLAFSLIIANLADRIWGPDPIAVQPPWPLSIRTTRIGPIRVNSYQVALVLLTVAIVFGLHRFYRTRAGKAMLAMAEDRDAALLRGINPDRISRLSFFLGGAVAALTGLLAAPLFFSSTTIGTSMLITGFATAAVGGVGNNKGALLAGYIIGIVEAAAAALLSPAYQKTVVFGLLLVILLVKPQGLFGTEDARRV
ncbi:MAG TPA: branched-chain amino acid ABC transporter permease [Rhodoblastus sp.]|nr:branched-chain amino acid ABC transporter permease [Rhodoblastus sp.]